MNTVSRKRPWLKLILIVGTVLLVIGGGVYWYLFNLKFDDTRDVKADYTVNAVPFMKEFMDNDSLANQKYAEKIIIVNGVISDVEQPADTTVNIKMTDSLSGSYIIFAFQSKDMSAVRKLKAGDQVSIKGSCSGGIFSRILETESITFKRCVINQ